MKFLIVADDWKPPRFFLITTFGCSTLQTNLSALPAATARVRIQTVLNAQAGDLRFSLLDMTENGGSGDAVTVSNNGTFTLPDFAGSALTSLDVTMNDYANLLTMVRNEYAGRLVDIFAARQQRCALIICKHSVSSATKTELAAPEFFLT